MIDLYLFGHLLTVAVALCALSAAEVLNCSTLRMNVCYMMVECGTDGKYYSELVFTPWFISSHTQTYVSREIEGAASRICLEETEHSLKSDM